MLDENAIIAAIQNCPSREAATDQARAFLAEHGWFVADQEAFDVMAIHPDGYRLIIKFWIRAEQVPKFYMKDFDHAVQDFLHKNDLKDNVMVLLLSNTPLDTEAYTYYKSIARFTMKVGFLDDISAQLITMQEQVETRGKNVQKQLLQYLAV
ncbi:MAG TPA: hypothetical protein VKM55_30745 [Candidatus Lokiarchaeia archaeon]|nr:hypothetical protein [Candidatus Lokiarchaeia archaeon]